MKSKDVDPRIYSCDMRHCDELTKPQLAFVLQRFITEVNKRDGKPYPGKTLYEMIVMFQFQLERKGYRWKILNEPEFTPLRNTLDNLMKQRAKMGLGLVNKSEPATLAIQSRLWELGLLGDDTPDKLRQTVQFLIGYHFALRGGQEHRQLRAPGHNPQITEHTDEDGVSCLRYKEDVVSKADQGGLGRRKHNPKIVYAYGPSNPSHNILHLYRKYVSLCPGNTCDALFLHSRTEGKMTPTLWYTKRPVGINTLSLTVKKIMEAAEIPGKWTNHSLRSGAATTLHRHNVEEHVIQEVTGHKSDCVRSYKHSDATVHRMADRVLSGSPDKTSGLPAKTLEADDQAESSLARGDPSLFDWTGAPLVQKQSWANEALKPPAPVLKLSIDEYQKRAKERKPIIHVENAAAQAPGRSCMDPFSCQDSKDVCTHTQSCAIKKDSCSNFHAKDKCCSFLCGFGDFLNGGQTSKVPLKKLKLSLSFHKGEKKQKKSDKTTDEPAEKTTG